jgi:hypothetical protein
MFIEGGISLSRDFSVLISCLVFTKFLYNISYFSAALNEYIVHCLVSIISPCPSYDTLWRV